MQAVSCKARKATELTLFLQLSISSEDCCQTLVRMWIVGSTGTAIRGYAPVRTITVAIDVRFHLLSMVAGLTGRHGQLAQQVVEEEAGAVAEAAQIHHRVEAGLTVLETVRKW